MDLKVTDLLSREQAAAELGLSLGALRNLNRDGRITFHKISQRCIRVTRADLDGLKAELLAGVNPATQQ